jgi:hypothetical protein
LARLPSETKGIRPQATDDLLFRKGGRPALEQQLQHLERLGSQVDDLAAAQKDPPVVRVSDDGSMGWVLSRLRVKRTGPGRHGAPQERAFVYAGIMTYEKRDGRWLRVANVSTFE